MTTLDCVKPGASFGQVRLVVDLSVAGNIDAVLTTLSTLGYKPTFQLVSLQSGVHVLAILKDEQHDSCVEPDYLIEEWQNVRSHVEPKSVHLWRKLAR